MTTGWEPSEFFALAARLNANGIKEARPPESDETAGVYLTKLYGWVLDACERIQPPTPPPVFDEPIRGTRPDDHLIDHDAVALLRGETLDPKKVGISFTYRRGNF